MPCHGFLFSLPRCGTEYVRTARHGCLIPCSTLSCCSTPRTPLRLPCSPAVVSLSPGVSRQPATAAPCRGCRSYFSFSCYGSLFNLHQSPATHTPLQANISPRSSPLIIFQCSGCFVSLHTDILLRQIIRNCWNNCCQGSASVSHRLYLPVNIPSQKCNF